MGEALWPDVVTGQARRIPTAVAVNGVGPTLTYGELDAWSGRFADRLIRAGIGPEQLVALVMERSSALIVAMLAVAKSGAGHLLVDPAQPMDRLTYILTDAKPTAIITDGAVTDGAVTDGSVAVHASTIGESRLIEFGADGTDLIDTTDNAANASDTRPVTVSEKHLPPRLDRLAYAIYTSGSTGQPKGVLVTHRGVMTMVEQQIAHFTVRPTSRVLQCASIGFDAAFSEIAMALCAGARLELATAAQLSPGPELAATVACRQISHLTITPSALSVLDPADLPSVSTLVIAGEECPPSLVDRWAPGRRLVNAYGPSETTVCATMSDPLTGGKPPIGRPLAGTTVVVVDERLRPVPVGTVGELCVGGAGVARGYLDRPGLTAERFVADPRGEDDGRFYRTGDLGYLDESGLLWFVGRGDDQVKIRGQRVDLGEVRAVLGEHPSVRDVRVVVRPDTHGGNQLAAYVVTTESTDSPAALAGSLRHFLRRRLPEAMVPATITTLDHLPLNENGKLDVAALPAPALPESLKSPESPESPAKLSNVDSDGVDGTTRLLTDLFADTLELDTGKCGADSDFFDLGGHSLTGAVLLGRVRAVFGVRLTLPDLALAPTPRALSERLRRSNSAESGAAPMTDLLPLRPRGKQNHDESTDAAPPLFCLPPAGGLGWSYGRLLGAIAPAHPVYAIQLPHHDPPLESMDAAVEHCLKLIRTTRPHGPYHLLGWSFGGVLAHAVAVALRHLGEQVDLLAVLDGYPGSGGTRAATGTTDAELDEQTMCRLLVDSAGPHSASTGLADTDVADTDLADTVSWPDGMVAIARANIRAQREHIPEVFDGRMTLFTARGTDRPGGPDSTTWRRYLTEDPDVVEVPADHHRMLGPQSLAVLAPVLAELLGDPADEQTSDATGAIGGAGAGIADGTAEWANRADPFDGRCQVLGDAAGRLCLWPAELVVPTGWRVVVSGQSREQCLSYVERCWTDPLPRTRTEKEIDERIDV